MTEFLRRGLPHVGRVSSAARFIDRSSPVCVSVPPAGTPDPGRRTAPRRTPATRRGSAVGAWRRSRAVERGQPSADLRARDDNHTPRRAGRSSSRDCRAADPGPATHHPQLSRVRAIQGRDDTSDRGQCGRHNQRPPAAPFLSGRAWSWTPGGPTDQESPATPHDRPCGPLRSPGDPASTSRGPQILYARPPAPMRAGGGEHAARPSPGTTTAARTGGSLTSEQLSAPGRSRPPGAGTPHRSWWCRRAPCRRRRPAAASATGRGSSR